MDLAISVKYFAKGYELTSLDKRDILCLLWGSNWFFM